MDSGFVGHVPVKSDVHEHPKLHINETTAIIHVCFFWSS